MVTKRTPSSKNDELILDDARIWASFARYGVGVLAAGFATKIISKNA
jgi:hypothetical protein